MAKRFSRNLLESIMESLLDLGLALLKSLIFAPMFFLFCRLTEGHGPTHEMWTGFIFAAVFYTRVSKSGREKFVAAFRRGFSDTPAAMTKTPRIIRPGDKDFYSR